MRTGESYLNLANAAVELWADDYRQALTAYKAETDSAKALEYHNRCRYLKKGLTSQWGNTLSRGLSKYIVQKLEDEAGLVRCANCKEYRENSADASKGFCCISGTLSDRCDFCKLGTRKDERHG